jgi:hypothetical protein
MISLRLATAALVLFAAPSFAQTNAGGAAEGASEAAPAVTPQPPQENPTLPGVADPATTGSTTNAPAGADAGDSDRCEAPGMSGNTNPTSNMPSVTEADPTCR